MFFRQIIHDDLGCASYLVACGGKAAVFDPQWDIEPYMRLAASQNLTITDILLTHNHADHVSGHGRLHAATGARIHVSANANAQYVHEPLRDGDTISIGQVDLLAFATPGHRPEHTSFLVIDHARSEQPWALISGDFVFVGDIARPDLAVEPRDGAVAIHESLQRLKMQNPTLEIWPGHTGGSLCGGAGMSRKPSSTLGFELHANSMLSCNDVESFVDQLTSGLRPQPPNFQGIVELNRGPLLTDRAESQPLSPSRVKELLDDGAVLIDVRDSREYDAEHIPGSLNVTATAAGVGTRAAWLTRPDASIIVNAAAEDDARMALVNLQAAGLLNTCGYLNGGISAWRQSDHQIDSTPALDIPALAELLHANHADHTILVDVREDHEWRHGHVAGSIHVPVHELRDHIPDELRHVDAGTRIAVACSAGNRSALAASHLRRVGIENVDRITDGGIPDLEYHNIQLTTED